MAAKPSSVARMLCAGSPPSRLGLIAMILWLLASALFVAFPGSDLQEGNLFYAGTRRSLGRVQVIRSRFVSSLYVCAATTIARLILTRNRGRAPG